MHSVQSNLRSAARSPMFWVFMIALLAAIASNLTAGDSTKRESKPSETRTEPLKIVREGSRLEARMMRAKLAGEDIVWEAEDNKQTFEALENLALERVVDAIRADGTDRLWIVTGTVTEFRGSNYILVERATRAPRAN